MNPINKIFNDLSDSDLICAMSELSECDETGILPSGVTRDCANKVKDITQQRGLDIMTAQILIYKECATRWLHTRKQLAEH